MHRVYNLWSGLGASASRYDPVMLPLPREHPTIQMHKVQVVVMMMMMMMMVRMGMMRMTMSFGVGVCQGDSVVAMLFMMLRNDGHFKEA